MGEGDPEAPLLARIPEGAHRRPTAAPAAVRAIAGRRRLREVWENELGGRTFEVGRGRGRAFVKWVPAADAPALAAEAARLAWAAPYASVPRVVGSGGDADGAWLVTAAIAGESAVTARWKAEPGRAVAALGRGLRALHDALPVAACPFSWSLERRLAAVRGARGRLPDPSRWHPVHRPLGVEGAMEVLARPPAVDRLVVCHGDACAPNTLIGDDGEPTGHVDLGALGVADRWADLAVATWSTRWNYGPGWEEPLLDAYGVRPDAARIAYYRLLWDLSP